MRPQLQLTARELKEKTMHNLSLAKERIVEGSKEAARRVDHEVHKKPWTYIGAAALMSAFVGFFAGRKSKKHK